jgi:hypothetical protein
VAGSARDLVLTLLAAALIALAVRGVLRSRTWARRHRPRRAVVRIFPHVLLVGVVSAAPHLQRLATGRTASWTLVFFVAPVPTAVLLTVTAITAVVPIFRLAWLIQTTVAGPMVHRATASMPAG